MPNKYLNDTRTGELIQKIYTADRAIATECKGYTDTKEAGCKTYTDTKVAALVDSAPGTLDTLNELATALGNDPNFATTIATLIDTKCAQAKAEALLAAHPVGSFYESTNSTSPATLFGGTWQEQIPDGELVGSIAYFAGQSSAPAGWVLCDGSAVSRTTYATLFSAVGTTYGAGDGSTTFALPNLINKFVEGSTTAGTTKAAGLPNIEGTFTPSVPYNASGSTGSITSTSKTGAFSNSGSTAKLRYFTHTGITTDDINIGVKFSASSSNSIYGNSTTVQPPALTMKPFIYTGKTSLYKWLRTA